MYAANTRQLQQLAANVGQFRFVALNSCVYRFASLVLTRNCERIAHEIFSFSVTAVICSLSLWSCLERLDRRGNHLVSATEKRKGTIVLYMRNHILFHALRARGGYWRHVLVPPYMPGT